MSFRRYSPLLLLVGIPLGLTYYYETKLKEQRPQMRLIDEMRARSAGWSAAPPPTSSPSSSPSANDSFFDAPAKAAISIGGGGGGQQPVQNNKVDSSLAQHPALALGVPESPISYVINDTFVTAFDRVSRTTKRALTGF